MGIIINITLFTFSYKSCIIKIVINGISDYAHSFTRNER